MKKVKFLHNISQQANIVSQRAGGISGKRILSAIARQLAVSVLPMHVHVFVVCRAAALVERTELVSLVMDLAQVSPMQTFSEGFESTDANSSCRWHPLRHESTWMMTNGAKSPAPTASRTQPLLRSPDNVTHQPRRR